MAAINEQDIGATFQIDSAFVLLFQSMSRPCHEFEADRSLGEHLRKLPGDHTSRSRHSSGTELPRRSTLPRRPGRSRGRQAGLGISWEARFVPAVPRSEVLLSEERLGRGTSTGKADTRWVRRSQTMLPASATASPRRRETQSASPRAIRGRSVRIPPRSPKQTAQHEDAQDRERGGASASISTAIKRTSSAFR